MINPFKEVDWNPGPAQKRRFAVTLAFGLPGLAVALLLIQRWSSGAWNPAPSLWLGGLGVGLGLLLLVLPAAAKPFYVVWYFLACCVGIVVSNLLLIGFFLVVLTPVGLLLRATGRAALKKSGDKGAATYWRESERISDVKRYYRQF